MNGEKETKINDIGSVRDRNRSVSVTVTMALDDEVARRLMGAIETEKLVFLCGAGLSLPNPSNLPSAASVANQCYDRWRNVEVLAPELRDDLNRLAGHFYKKDIFDKFISIVPWSELLGAPNEGHAAVADLLICRGASAALSANFDNLIERWAEERKVDLRGALTGQEAHKFTSETSPLLKLHGCMQRDRKNTLWTTDQLQDPEINAEIKTRSQWMNLHLPGKDLVVVGFWTDWGYLNDQLAAALAVQNAQSVVVINPDSEEALREKAPNLWATLNELSGSFSHIRASSEQALGELRCAFSRSWIRRFYTLGQTLINDAGNTLSNEATPDALDCNDLYDLRRDIEGRPYNRAARKKTAPVNSAHASFVHHHLLNAGAIMKGAWLDFRGKTIRVVNGAGQALGDVRRRYKEPPSIAKSDLVICAGAVDLGLPENLIRSGQGESIVHPQPGGAARWMTMDQANEELNL